MLLLCVFESLILSNLVSRKKEIANCVDGRFRENPLLFAISHLKEINICVNFVQYTEVMDTVSELYGVCYYMLSNP